MAKYGSKATSYRQIAWNDSAWNTSFFETTNLDAYVRYKINYNTIYMDYKTIYYIEYAFLFITGALQKKCSSEIMYKDIVKASSNDALMTNKQIEKDLLRIMPANACFSHLHSTGIPRLRRVMRALAWLYPDIGYVV